jgi:hypothetical protein
MRFTSHVARQESAVLASLLSLLGVVPAALPLLPSGAEALPGPTRGELLCQAFEVFRLLPCAQISFGHAVFLAAALAGGDLLRLGGCCECASLMLSERLPLRAARCHHCAGPAQSRC